MGHAFLAPGTGTPANAARVHVEFKLHPKHNPLKSAKEGREVWDEVEYLRIVVPGDRDEVHRPATERDKQQYAAEYAAFKAQASQEAVSGTPLSQAPFMTAARVLELASFNCRTVEQLAAMPDNVAQKFMAIQELKRKANDFLAAASGSAPVAQLRAELAQRDNQIQVLSRQVQQLAAALEKHQAQSMGLPSLSDEAPEATPAPAPRKRGRPPKAATVEG